MRFKQLDLSKRFPHTEAKIKYPDKIPAYNDVSTPLAVCACYRYTVDPIIDILSQPEKSHPLL
jgi:hypothetical protein